MSSLIKTGDLTKHFGTLTAVEGVSLRVAAGEVLALLGPNGAGKTTTIRMLAAILRPSRGWVNIDGFDSQRDGIEVRRRIGLLTEHHGLYSRMRAREYLSFFGEINRLGASQIETRCSELLDRFGLANESELRLGQFSKGMRQKLAMARALMHDPKVLLLDEPSMGLAPVLVDSIFETIKKLHADGTTILLVEQNARIALQVASRGYVLQSGTVVLSDTAENLRKNEMVRKAYMGEN